MPSGQALPQLTLDEDDAVRRTLEPVPLAAYDHAVVLHVRCPVEQAPEFMTWEGTTLRELEPSLCEYVTGTDDPGEAAGWLTGFEFEFTVIESPEVREAVAELGERLLRAAADPSREG